VYEKFNYILDPHGAVAFLGLESYRKKNRDIKGIFLGTAHPAKFNTTVEEQIPIRIPIPESLTRNLDKDVKNTKVSPVFRDLKDFLLG